MQSILIVIYHAFQVKMSAMNKAWIFKKEEAVQHQGQDWHHRPSQEWKIKLCGDQRNCGSRGHAMGMIGRWRQTTIVSIRNGQPRAEEKAPARSPRQGVRQGRYDLVHTRQDRRDSQYLVPTYNTRCRNINPCYTLPTIRSRAVPVG